MPASGTKVRPLLLTWLCTGSFIFGSLWIVMLLALIVLSFEGKATPQLFPGLVLQYLKAGYLFVAVEILLTLLGIAGVVRMWQLKKNGFYLYALSKTMLYFLPALFVGMHHLDLVPLTVTSILIIIYGVLIPDFKRNKSAAFRK